LPLPAQLPASSITTTKKKIAKLTLWPLWRDILHGVWRQRTVRRNYSWRDTGTDLDLVVPACAVVFTDSVHDRRAFERAAGGGGYYRMGAARTGKFLGISGSMLSLAASILIWRFTRRCLCFI